MSVVDGPLDSDPARRWQVLRDLTDAPAAAVAAERARVATEGWGADLLRRRDLRVDPAAPAVRETVALVARNSRWEHEGQAFFDGREHRRAGRPRLAPAGLPDWWHDDVLRGLDPLRAAGPPDPRAAEAVEVLRARRTPDGTWLLEQVHPGDVHLSLGEAVGRPSRWTTLRALRVLRWWDGLSPAP